MPLGSSTYAHRLFSVLTSRTSREPNFTAVGRRLSPSLCVYKYRFFLISLNGGRSPAHPIVLACRVTMGQLNGMRTLTIENGLLEAVLLLDKGGDIIELRDKTFDIDVMWHSPKGQ